MKRLFYLLVGVAVSALALAYSLANVDLKRMLDQLSSADHRVLPLMLALLTLYYLVTAGIWIQLLRPIGRYHLKQVGPAMMIGFGFNNLLPAHLGEIARAAVFARQHRCSFASVFASLALERVLDVVSILIIYFVATQAGATLPESMRAGAQIVALAMIALVFGIFLFLRLPSPFLRLWSLVSAGLPLRWGERSMAMLKGVASGLSAVESPRRVALTVGLALIKWCINVVLVWSVLLAFHAAIAISTAVVVIVVSALAVSMPSAPGAVGTMQAAFVFILTRFGVSPEVAFAGSLYLWVVQWFPVTAAGMASFLWLGIHFKDLQMTADATSPGSTSEKGAIP